MNPEVDILLYYMKLKKAEEYLKNTEDFNSLTKNDLLDKVYIEQSHAEHLLNNPWLLKVSQ